MNPAPGWGWNILHDLIDGLFDLRFGLGSVRLVQNKRQKVVEVLLVKDAGTNGLFLENLQRQNVQWRSYKLEATFVSVIFDHDADSQDAIGVIQSLLGVETRQLASFEKIVGDDDGSPGRANVASGYNVLRS